MPWVLYAVCAMYFFATQIGVKKIEIDDFKNSDKIFSVTLGCLTIVLLLYQMIIEILQLMGTTFSDYICTFPNVFDIFQLTSTLFIVILRLIESEHTTSDSVRIVAAVSVFLLWMKMFDWLKLFEPTSFYIKLVTATFRDIASFMLLFFTSLAMFGTAMYML